ncbi:hypothetical protein [Sporosarcina sp. FSL W7-1283]|uniref:hypothetical protein n=1 Tax=Sporosarcina sp. FSL W7-1283 TaxID=2921560 RepID=UPI0030F8E3C8
MSEEFLEEEDYIVVIPTIDKPIKLVYENQYNLKPTGDPMVFAVTTKMTVREAALRMNMSIDEFLEWINTI